MFGDFGVGASASGDNRVGINTFSANVVQTPLASVGIVTITATGGGNSVVRGTSPAIPGIFKEGNLVRFTQTSSTSDDKVLAKVLVLELIVLQLVKVSVFLEYVID